MRALPASRPPHSQPACERRLQEVEAGVKWESEGCGKQVCRQCLHPPILCQQHALLLLVHGVVHLPRQGVCNFGSLQRSGCTPGQCLAHAPSSAQLPASDTARGRRGNAKGAMQELTCHASLPH